MKLNEMPHIDGKHWFADLRVELYYNEFENEAEGKLYSERLIQSIYKKHFFIIPIANNRLFLRCTLAKGISIGIITKSMAQTFKDVILPSFWRKYLKGEGFIKHINATLKELGYERYKL
jgi:hypothetical protein